MKKVNKLKIIKLIKEYCKLEDGFYIEKYLELILVSIDPDIYISRRALKHFVERRKGELLKNNIFAKTVEILISMILYIKEVVQFPDNITKDALDNKIIYEKLYNKENNISIRLVMETIEYRQEIRSLHYIKTKKPP